jgi:hypothetical protein
MNDLNEFQVKAFDKTKSLFIGIILKLRILDNIMNTMPYDLQPSNLDEYIFYDEIS